MAAPEFYIAICNQCPFRERPCADADPCACQADHVDIREHAKAAHCPLNLYPADPQRSLVGTVAHGLAGIARAVTGTGGAEDPLVERRLSICATCPHNVVTLGMVNRCELCGCLTWAKARNLEEKCPAGKW